jgi:hypothetical protein
MPVCPNCRYEYKEGIKVCPDCGMQLVDVLNEIEWVVVFTSDKVYEVEMMKAELESADITATVLSQKDSSFPVPGDLAIVKLLVPKEEAAAAINYINDIKNSKGTEEE